MKKLLILPLLMASPVFGSPLKEGSWEDLMEERVKEERLKEEITREIKKEQESDWAPAFKTQ